MADGFTTLLLNGLAVYLAAGGIGATYNSSGLYTATQTGIAFGKLPDTPDSAIVLSAYGIGQDDPSLSDSGLGVQVICRCGGADPRLAADLSDAVFDLLHGVQHLTLSTGVHVIQCRRNSGPASLGQDSNNRWALTQNFYADLHRPSSFRT